VVGGHSFNGLSKVYGNGLLCLLYQHVEAKDVWPHERFEDNIKCLVPIGTVVPSLTPFGKIVLEIGKALVALATETDKTAETFAKTQLRRPNSCWERGSSGNLGATNHRDGPGESHTQVKKAQNITATP
jgi:hypothetical protein